jgi:lipopolysaccharide transport system ATP-binding protein
VLSVGDYAFQKRCLGKMEEVATSGRTVLFVSHNMSAVASLCRRAYLLDRGRVVAEGAATEVVHQYRDSYEADQLIPIREREDRRGDGSIRVTGLRIESADGGPAITSNSGLKVSVDYESEAPLRTPRFQVTIHDDDYHPLYLLDTDGASDTPEMLPSHGTLVCVTDPIRLTPGTCGLMVGVHRGPELADGVEYAGAFEVQPDGSFDSGRIPLRSEAVGLLGQRWTLAGPEDAA